MILSIIAAWFIADILTGIFHWFQDSYIETSSKYEYVVALAEDNEFHHNQPAAMTKLSEWENISNSIIIGFPVAALLFAVGSPVVVWLPFIFGSFGNLVHRYSHLSPNNIPTVIKWMQWTGFFCSPKHHIGHHLGPNGLLSKQESFEKYCPMTNYMNPILDRLKFFRAIEYCLSIVGIKREKI